MSKIKYWDEQTQSWVITGASNAANIELTNPAFLDEEGNSISVDLGFTKVDNRMNKLERNLAWIYQNGAKGGSGGGSGGSGIDSTEYTITVEEGSRVYTAGTSVTIHLTINGGSLRKIFQVEISNALTGERLASPTVTGLTRTEITINGLTEATQVLKISAHTGLYYASDFILTVVAGAIKLSSTRLPLSTIYPTTEVYTPNLTATNSTDSDLLVVVEYTKDEITYNRLPLLNDSIENTGQASYNFTLSEISNFLKERAQEDLGETYRFNIYVLGVLNDNLLVSNVISFRTTITVTNTLYILTYGVKKLTPQNEGDLLNLNQFVYGQPVQFYYELFYSDSYYRSYNVHYNVAPCYFELGILVTDSEHSLSGDIERVETGTSPVFSFSTASLPQDTIYDSTLNEFKFVKVTLTATSRDNSSITDTKVVYVTLSHAIEKYITATNFDKSLVCYYSPVMGVPTGNINVWTYDNQNNLFPYSRQGMVQQRYIDLVGYNVNGMRNGFTSQGIHLTGKSYALLALNLFSSQGNEVNLLNGNGFTISTTFRTDANIDDNAVALSLGRYINGSMVAGIEILASKVRVLVNRQETSLNITKGDLVTVDIVFERYVGEGDTEDSPTHWFIKIFLNGVLSSLGSYTYSLFTSVSLGTGWYFNDYLCLGAHIEGEEVINAADVHFYDFKVYSTAVSDNEITLNYVSATIYSELDNGANPSLTLQTEMLSKNFILMSTSGEYESLLFDTNNAREYKDDDTLLSTLRAALADSKIPYPIVVVNLVTANSNFFGTTQAQFSEDLKAIVTGQEYRYPINIDYYTMGNTTATRIANSDKMLISIQGTSSLQFVSKNYEIYMGQDEEGKDVLVQMREDWLPENEYTLKADVMDSAHVNNVLIGRIINGMVTTTDSAGNEVSIKPLDNTPPMNVNNTWASKIKHTSEGYPVILFINFRRSDNSTVCRCQGIYNFNLGRAASFNLGLKLLTSCTFVDNAATFPRMVESYEQNLVVTNNAPVYSIEVGENNQQIGAFDLDDPNILSSGIFDTIYASDGAANTHLQRLLSFLASFGFNIENPKKVLVDQQWCTPKIVRNGNAWEESGQYYYPANNADYVQSTLDLHMNWNNLIAYYMIAIIFGLVDSMGKNLTLRTWNTTADENGLQQCVWYMCFYDMDTAMRLDNDGNETVPYNAHLNRYYTDNSGVFSEAKVSHHSPSIAGAFTLVYSSYNTRLQEIAENLKDVSKTLNDVYSSLRNTLFPDPGAFIDTYYTGQINLIGAALYNYDYRLKYLQTKKQYSVQTGELLNTNDYNLISYLHGNGATNIKSWFKKRVRFLDGVYGASTDGTSTLNNAALTDVTLNELWSNNQAIKNMEDPTVVLLTLAAESLTFINISAGTATRVTLWINETPTTYKVRNVGAQQRVSVYGNKVITTLDGFNKFRWVDLNSIVFPLVKSLSLKGASNINASAFLTGQATTDLQSLRELDLSDVTLIRDSSIVYQGLTFTLNLPSLEWLDISNSSFNAVSLPLSGVLKYLNVSNTKIKEIEFSGLPLLETLILEGCNELESITLTNCPKLKSLNIPASVKVIKLTNCPGLQSLTCVFSGRLVSELVSIEISSCEGLKEFNITGQNNPELSVRLEGAPNLEIVNLSNIATDNVIFSNAWTSLKRLNISNTFIGALNYNGSVSTILDLTRHKNLENITATNNYAITEVHCPNVEGKYITLESSAFSDCSALTSLIGNFLLNGVRIFQGCSQLKINASYSGIAFTSEYVSGNFCNMNFADTLSSYQEMFAGCSSLSGQDFRYLMSRVKENVTNLSKMFLNCSSMNVELWNDIFSKCPNVTDITSFCEGSGVTGAFYSTNTERTGIIDYLPNLRIINYAFAGTRLTWIDDNAFKDNTSITEADYVFSNCTNLLSCIDTYNPTPGYLHSKTFFTNLSNLTNIFPKGMFQGCQSVKMTVDSKELSGGIMFDYLFHYPKDKVYESTTLTNSLYTGVKLSGTLHTNVFGGLTNTDGTYNIPSFNVISGPFANSGGELYADLEDFEDLFKNLDPISLVNVLKGITFNSGTTNHIPENIFKGCSNLVNLSGFFSNPSIDNNGEEYEFPTRNLFKDCTKLQNVSLLFDGDYNLNIKLVGEGFVNNPITNVSGMLRNSGVFGYIPYKFLRTTGKTITDLDNIFSGCYKLGYTSNRTILIGASYQLNDKTQLTTWDDAVIGNSGSPIYFHLDFSSLNDAEELYIDGTPWPTSWLSLSVFDSEVNTYDEKQQVALSGTLGRTENVYQNYMFPADLFYSCADTCTFTNALKGLTYTTNVLAPDENGILHKEEGPKDGVKGRLPMKLFSNNGGITEIENLFEGLDFCPFVGFSSLIYDVEKQSAADARGIKLPPDLFRYTPRVTSLTETFKGIEVEAGIDMNLNLSYLPSLTSVRGMLSNVQFHDSPVSGTILRGDDEGTYLSGVLVTYPLVAEDTFLTNHELRDISSLFAVTNMLGDTKGLIHITSAMFLPEDALIHPYLSNVSNCFYNNTLLSGTIPLMLGSYITSWAGYIEGVNKGNIINANDFTSVHSDMTWWPTSWRNED